MTKIEEIDQAYSRLMAHQYALEVLTTTVLACMPAADADRWLTTFTAKLDRVTVRENVAVDDIRATRITRDGLEMLEGFAAKVRALLENSRRRA